MTLESCLDDIATFILNINSESTEMIQEPEPNTDLHVLNIDNLEEFIISCDFDPVYNHSNQIRLSSAPPPYTEEYIDCNEPPPYE